MSRPRILVVGAGKRVREDVLPVLASLEGELELSGVLARSARRLEGHPTGLAVDVEPLAELTRERLREAALCFVAVSKGATPEVLARLAALDPSATTLLIETPVLLYKHLGHASKLRRFRAAFVAEDCVDLPCFDPLDAALASGEVGELRGAVFSHSAYAYHGVATARRVLRAGRVWSATRRQVGGRVFSRELRFGRGLRALILEPRDYRAGHALLAGTRGTIGDHPLQGERPHLELAAEVESGTCRGFRIGEHRSRAADEELVLLGASNGGPGVFAWMDGMKRVGLRRAFLAALAGKGYPLALALEDMVVDYHLEKLGVWVANPLTGPGSPLARLLR